MPPRLPAPHPLAITLPVERLRLALRGRRVRWWLAVLALAALTATAVARLTADAEAALARYGPTRPVVVAVADLPAGAPVGPDRVRIEERPVGLLAPDAIDALPAGAVTRAPVAAGEVLLARRIDPLGASPLAASLPAGTRGVAVPLTDAVPPLVDGDRVDVLVTPSGLDPTRSPAGVVGRGGIVVDVDERAVVVAVAAADADDVSAAVSAGLAALVLVPATG